MQPYKVGRLLASDIALQPVVEKALKIGALSRLCMDFLPPELASRIRVANVKDGQLSIFAATPAAAAKLKMLSESLGKYLSEQGAKINSVSVRVQPGADRVPGVAARRHCGISRAGINALQELHRKIPDSPARRALKTLLDHHVKREPDAAGQQPPAAPPRRARK